MKLNEGMYNDITDDRYEKTIFVKTWTGRTVSVETDLNCAVETVKRQLEAKTGIPKDHQHLASKGKVLEDSRTLKDCYISGGETIEMTALLVGGTKHKSLSPTPMEAEREKKRKESEPYIDVSGLEDEKLESAASEDETATTKQWMKSMVKELKDRTDDISEFEKTMTWIKFEMAEVKTTMDKMADTFSKIVDESQKKTKNSSMNVKKETKNSKISS